MTHQVQIRDVRSPKVVYDEVSLPFLPQRDSYVSVGDELYYVTGVYIHSPSYGDEVCATLIVDLSHTKPRWME